MRLTARLLLAAAFAGLVSLFGQNATAPMKVAVVDVQRAVMQTEDGLRAQATLKKLFDSRQQELNKSSRSSASRRRRSRSRRRSSRKTPSRSGRRLAEADGRAPADVRRIQ
jgi:outer membrane protein